MAVLAAACVVEVEVVAVAAEEAVVEAEEEVDDFKLFIIEFCFGFLSWQRWNACKIDCCHRR